MGIAFGDYRYESGFSGFGAVPNESILGRQVLEMYHASMKRFPVYKTTIDAQLKQWSKNLPKVEAVIVDGIGFQARISNLTLDQLKDAMNTLANKRRGIALFSYQEIGQAIGHRAANPTIWETVSAVSKDSASDIASGLQNVGKDVIGTYKMAKFLLPVAGLAIIAGLFYRAKGGNLGVGGMISGLKAAAKKKLQLNPRLLHKRKSRWIIQVGKNRPEDINILSRKRFKDYSDPGHPQNKYVIKYKYVDGGTLGKHDDMEWQPKLKKFLGRGSTGSISIRQTGQHKPYKRRKKVRRKK